MSEEITRTTATQTPAEQSPLNSTGTIDNMSVSVQNNTVVTTEEIPLQYYPEIDPPEQQRAITEQVVVDPIEETAATNEVTIQQETVESLRSMFEAAVRSPFYMSNPKRVAALESALAIPVSDDKSFQQFYNHAEKDLLADAYRNALKSGGTPVEVTNIQIMAEAQTRYVAKHGKGATVNEEYTV